MIYALVMFAVLLPVAAAFAATVVSFRPPKPDKRELDGRKVTFSCGKKRLSGCVWNENGTRGLIVLAHGMGTSIAYHLPEVQHFVREGYKVFAFAYSGYGESDGRFYGFPQAVSDLKCAVEYIDDGSLPLILIGHSMGGYAVCTVPQCLTQPVSAVIAYAPFYADGAAIQEMTRGMPRYGWLLRALIVPLQLVLFRKGYGLNGVDGLRSAEAPALVLQGCNDVEVTCEGCSVYAHREELAGTSVEFRLIEQADSSEHMTVVRKRGTREINADTMKLVDDFLEKL